MTKHPNDSLKQQVYNALFSDIINGNYPADTILTEKFLMEKYNVSRAPIREALTQLTGTRLLSSIPRQGYKILQPSAEQLLEGDAGMGDYLKGVDLTEVDKIIAEINQKYNGDLDIAMADVRYSFVSQATAASMIRKGEIDRAPQTRSTRSF